MFYNRFYRVDPFKPNYVEFQVWSAEDIKKLSVAKIDTFITFDTLGYPVTGGLHDARLGPLKFQSDPCPTCQNNMMNCTGHFGHIELPVPVFNPLFSAIVANFLKISCLHCYSTSLSEPEKIVLTTQLRLIDLGCLVEARKLDHYLEEFDYKQTDRIKEEMMALYNELSATRRTENLSKNVEDVWRYYCGRIFQRKSSNKCPHCQKPFIKVTFTNGRFYMSCRASGANKIGRTHLMATTVQEHMRKLWENERDLLKTLIKVLSVSKETYPTDQCFTTVIPVTPSNTRPVQIIRNKPVEHSKNAIYRRILQDCVQLRQIMQVMNGQEVSNDVQSLVEAARGASLNEKMHNAWHGLQVSVNAMLDTNALKGYVNMSLGVSKIGLKQLIEKKSGILRKNMMGKRVDYFARSVITPDPLLRINEVGVPGAFAKKLTLPVPVTPWNVTELREMVKNGPANHPGANIVESDDGSLVWISETNEESRQALAQTLLTPDVDSTNPKVVHRHLRDGDMLLFNRQPSLHKPSVMAHKARVLDKEKTFRLHYANCKSYNADFDGDEMNAHLPQSQLAQAESALIMNACHQYLVPRDGTPLSGLIQDHVIAAFRLTLRGRFFERLAYHQLVFQGLAFFVKDIKLLPPAILKPKRLWSGKQVISTIIMNLTPKNNQPLSLYSKSKINFTAWPTVSSGCGYMTDKEREFMSETNVIIWHGELVCGVLDKNHVGSTHYSVVHSFYELYGGEYSEKLLSALSKLLTSHLNNDGFSLGVEDIIVQKKADRRRRKVMSGLEGAGIQAAKTALGIAEDEFIDLETLEKRLEVAHKKNSNFKAHLDHEYKKVLDPITNKINKICLPKGLVQPFPANNLQLMVQSGAKGSSVNTMQISCLLGQIELEGKRPPLMISGKSLPSVRPYDISPMSGGFIPNRFMSGIHPRGFFFHCMAGREGLIDTAVKTSRSGYLQRCLIKHLEGLVVHYDSTVRDSDNSIIQWRYGEDGLDVTKSQLLKFDQFPFFVENIDALNNKEDFAALKKDTAKAALRSQKKNIEKWKLDNKSTDRKLRRDSGFLQFCREMANEHNLLLSEGVSLPGRTSEASALVNLWFSLHEETRKKYELTCDEKCSDPVISDFAPDRNFGSVSENVDEMLQRYLNENKKNMRVKKSKLKDAVYWKSFTSLCQPGEPVGILAAQSVGEPSTQMTLNTFHFAGRGEMNVTLGIPRLREILMVASRKIKTPYIEIPFRSDIHRLEKRAEKLRRNFTRIVLKDVLEKINVKEEVVWEKKIRKYRLRLHYLPRKLYSSKTNLKPSDIVERVETKVISMLEKMLKKHLTKISSADLKIDDCRMRVNLLSTSGEKDDDDVSHDNLDGETSSEVKKNSAASDSDDDNSDIDGDGDATEAKSRSRQTDGQEYDEDEDNENDDDYKESKLDVDYNNDVDDDDDGGEKDTDAVKVVFTPQAKKRKSDLIVPENWGVTCLQHDSVSNSWTSIEIWASLLYKRLDLSTLLKLEAENVVIHEVPGIKRAFTYVNDEGLLTLKTEGSTCLSELFKYERLLNLNKLYANDVHAVAETYGIEAASKVIIREIKDVFKVYGITVDPRHLSLIAAYMTSAGTYQALNRYGMDNCSSPLQQMTFETTLKYLKNATLRNIKDNLQSPSGSLMVGQVSKIGSGLIELHHR